MITYIAEPVQNICKRIGESGEWNERYPWELIEPAIPKSEAAVENTYNYVGEEKNECTERVLVKCNSFSKQQDVQGS